ncbi:hypothetical protein Pst134EA_017499 [Puccinia striiformis f. sp. tritici]|uniref:hypothetical protein n=1 Tax=Puccinia striiformis f. sp. tritici TaxID=168172 RepID=UPI002008C6D2|nr:hypothetical protein Pst134EA_017499 [Puccinia striiformis f. sp. tritici]KAH9461190.1 hypothetical protein Pst134EA_017499 [Puccinia striiformis f. sp. tritici]
MSQYLDSWHEIHILRVKVVFGWTHLLSILAVEQDTDPIWGTRYKHRQRSLVLPIHPPLQPIKQLIVALSMGDQEFDTMSDHHLQLAYHQVHHVLVRRRRVILGLERDKLLFLAYQMYTHLTKKKPIRKHISILTGAMWMDELIHNPNGASFYENMGMKVSSFMTLQNLLEDHGALYDSKHVTATEKLGILLYMLITGLSNRKLQQRFQRSASTISITINQLVKDITCHRVLI